MRMLLIIVCCLCPPWLWGSPQEEQRDSPSFVSCVTDLQIPRNGPSQKQGDSTGPIKTVITIGAEGALKLIEFKGGEESSHQIITAWMRMSKFSPQCAGKTVTILFTFETEGPPTDYPFSWVSFRTPNHFIVHSRARIPHIFRSPVPKK